jgi:hypothetical protein
MRLRRESRLSDETLGEASHELAAASINDVTEDLRALGPSGTKSCRPESDDEVVVMNLTGPDGTLIRVPIFCTSPAGRPRQ